MVNIDSYRRTVAVVCGVHSALRQPLPCSSVARPPEEGIGGDERTWSRDISFCSAGLSLLNGAFGP